MKVVVIGTGFGRYAVAPVFRQLGFEVDLVTPRDADAVDRALAGKADLVSIHSPPFMHLEHVRKALDHGHAVLCDKPFGRNAGEARAMRDLAVQAGVLHFANFEMRCKPSRAKILELIRSGAIGRPVHLNWTFISNGFRGGPHGWVNEKDLGGGWINAYGSHLIDFMRCVFDSDVANCGGVVRIEDPMRRDRDGIEHAATAEDAYSAWFMMGSGATAAHDTSYASVVPMPSRVAIMGTEGAIELVNDTRLIVRRALDVEGLSAEERIRRGLLTGEGDETFNFQPAPGEAHAPSLIAWFTRVKESLEAGRQIRPSFEDGLAVAEAMDLLRSNVITA